MILYMIMNELTNSRSGHQYSSPEISEFIKPELYMTNCTSKCNQSSNVQCVEANYWDNPRKPHMAAVVQRFLHVKNYKYNEKSCQNFIELLPQLTAFFYHTLYLTTINPSIDTYMQPQQPMGE